MVGCRDYCKDTAVDMSHVSRRHGLYNKGYRYCSNCQCYFHLMRRCPCCNRILRWKSITPKQKYYKNKNINKNIMSADNMMRLTLIGGISEYTHVGGNS
jgi:hypothetical protein